MSTIQEKNLFKVPKECLKCGKKYSKGCADTLISEDNFTIFHLTCFSCQTSVIFHVVLGKEGVLSVGTLTDAGKEDIEKLKNGKIISVDDVIEAYQEMKK